MQQLHNQTFYPPQQHPSYPLVLLLRVDFRIKSDKMGIFGNSSASVLEAEIGNLIKRGHRLSPLVSLAGTTCNDSRAVE